MTRQGELEVSRTLLRPSEGGDKLRKKAGGGDRDLGG